MSIIKQPRDISDLYKARALGEQPNSIDYQIEKSGLFDGSTGYLEDNYTVDGSRLLWSFHTRFKRSSLGSIQYLWSVTNAGESPPRS